MSYCIYDQEQYCETKATCAQCLNQMTTTTSTTTTTGTTTSTGTTTTTGTTTSTTTPSPTQTTQSTQSTQSTSTTLSTTTPSTTSSTSSSSTTTTTTTTTTTATTATTTSNSNSTQKLTTATSAMIRKRENEAPEFNIVGVPPELRPNCSWCGDLFDGGCTRECGSPIEYCEPPVPDAECRALENSTQPCLSCVAAGCAFHSVGMTSETSGLQRSCRALTIDASTPLHSVAKQTDHCVYELESRCEQSESCLECNAQSECLWCPNPVTFR